MFVKVFQVITVLVLLGVGVLYLEKKFVIGYEKRDHIVQNPIFCHFSNCHHFKASRVPSLSVWLLAVWAFYFTDLLEA